MILVGV